VQTSIRDVVEIARRVLQIRQEPEWASMAPRVWDTDTWVADNTRIRSELGWSPATSLEAGFNHMVEWLRSSPALWDVYQVHDVPVEPAVIARVAVDPARPSDR
jgi:nucleoside-diphosphate-sugar epimerase